MLLNSVKTYVKRCTNNSLLSFDKTISFLLELFYTSAFDFRICFGETLLAFYFDEIYTKCCTNNNVISPVKRLYLPALCA